jgi:hypothetical protein
MKKDKVILGLLCATLCLTVITSGCTTTETLVSVGKKCPTPSLLVTSTNFDLFLLGFMSLITGSAIPYSLLVST